VFDFGPVFRAEKSKTRRHLTEFWMMDAEMAFASWQDNMDVQEQLMKAILRYVLEHNAADFAVLERDTTTLERSAVQPFLRKTHAEVVAELQAMGSDIQPDQDLGADDETMLMEKYDVPLFVEKYPAAVKAFYMKPDPDDASRVLCSDLLAPEGRGEIIGGSERIADYDQLLAKMKQFNLPIEPFQWYLDLRKYGSVPHSGFGYGLERIVAWISGAAHIRETIPFPRMINRLEP
jgi:asparaginyl-tRNA synthetase